MVQSATPPVVDHALRATFKRALKKGGLPAVLPLLKADKVARLSEEQVWRAWATLQDAVDEGKEALRLAQADGNRDNDNALVEWRRIVAAEKELLIGIAENPGIRQTHDRLFKAVAKDAADDCPVIWRSRRDKIGANMKKAMKGLELRNPEFFKLRKILNRAADASLESQGLQPLKGFWNERLKSALFPPPEPLEKRVLISSYYDGPDGNPADQDLQGFHVAILESVKRLPMYLRRFLDEAGYVFLLAERLSHIDAYYLNEAATDNENRGMEANCKGVHVHNARQIDMPLLNRRREDGEWVTYLSHTGIDDIDMTVAHEVFHGVDGFMGDLSTNAGKIKQAYDSDLSYLAKRGLSAKELDLLSYFLPKSMGGDHDTIRDARTEAFVEIAAEKETGASQNFIGEFFPETAAELAPYLFTLQTVYGVCPHGAQMPSVSMLRRSSVSAASHPAYRLG